MSQASKSFVSLKMELDYIFETSLHSVNRLQANAKFEECDRIDIRVLSVVATKIISFLQVLHANRNSFGLMGSTIGAFSMNTCYANRTELPPNLKALYRPCALIAPDVEIICQNMLMGQKFLDTRSLAHKCIILHTLFKEQLSQQQHYDCSLRSINVVLRLASDLKRCHVDGNEQQILIRSLKDHYLSQIVSQDQSIFLQLIADVFGVTHFNCNHSSFTRC